MRAVVCALFVVGVSFVTTTVQENIEAVQIVKRNENSTFQYVEGNKLEQILNSEEIKDRYVVVVSVVGIVQSGKSFLLNLFLNYLRQTYDIISSVTTTAKSDWTNMDVANGFVMKKNRSGTTKGIWAWPEIFTHDNITYGTETGNKVAIILLDTEGLFHINKDLRHNTMIFALSTMFSSMQGFNVWKDVNGDAMIFLDIFSTYTVYGSRLMTNQITNKTDIPFQDFYFIVRESNNPHESGNETLERIFPDGDKNDQNYDTKTRLKSVWKTFNAFQLPSPGDDVYQPTFNGSAALIDRRFKDKVATVVPDILAPEKIVIKEINGNRVKAKELSYFLKTFTDIVEKNITIPTTLVEVLANASNWMVHQYYLQHYDDLMSANFSERKNATKSFFGKNELQQLHLMHKNTSMIQFKNRLKLGGDKFSFPFEKLLHDAIEERFKKFCIINDNIEMEYNRNLELNLGQLSALKMWIIVAAIGVVILFAVVQSLRKCNKAGRPTQDGTESQKTPEKR